MHRFLRTSVRFSALAALTAVTVAGCSGNSDALKDERDSKPQAAATGPAATTTAPAAQPTPPAGPAAGLPDASVGACAPAPNAAVALSAWRPPTPLHQPMCNAQDIAAIVNCYIGRDANACNAPVQLTCLTCVVSDKATAPAYGPIIFDEMSPAAPQLNVGGCVAAASQDPSPTGCGATVATADGCTHAACAACSNDSQSQCITAAAGGSCAAQDQAARACGQQFLATCKPAGNPVQQATALAQLFCM